MTTQAQVQEEVENVLKFLTLKASSRGLISSGQKVLATEFGLPHVTFHRHVHRLITAGRLTISGGGAYAKVLKLSGPPLCNAPQSLDGRQSDWNQKSGPMADGLSFGKVAKAT
jgi:hypothetical protein